MNVNKIALSTALMAISLSTFAGDLSINNRTKLDSTSIVNDGPCSTILGVDPVTKEEYGITRAGKEKSIPEKVLKSACIKNRTNCKADVYMTDHCSTNPNDSIATVYFDVSKGIKADKIVNKSSAYKVTGSGFSAVISEVSNSSRWLNWIFGAK